METAKSAGLQTSVFDLMALLGKTGFNMKSVKLQGAVDKLDVVIYIAEMVIENVGKRRKMKLGLEELEAFLKTEGMQTPSNDAKSLVEVLLALRKREIERLAYSNGKQDAASSTETTMVLAKVQKADDEFAAILAEMQQADIEKCFDIVPRKGDGEERLKKKRHLEQAVIDCDRSHKQAKLSLEQLKNDAAIKEQEAKSRIQAELQKRKDAAEHEAQAEHQRIDAEKQAKIQAANAWASQEEKTVLERLRQESSAQLGCRTAQVTDICQQLKQAGEDYEKEFKTPHQLLSLQN